MRAWRTTWFWLRYLTIRYPRRFVVCSWRSHRPMLEGICLTCGKDVWEGKRW